MKAVILAGGLGTRLSEETGVRPKPMVEIGGRPMLWHIMKSYSAFDINEFIICLGYKGYLIKEFFSNYFLHTSNVTFDLKNNRMEIHENKAEPWRVTLVDTGDETMTGGRIKRVQHLVGNEDFCLTYGDGLSDVQMDELIQFHRQHGKLATVTSVQPPGRFGTLDLKGNTIQGFREKPQGEGGWINGGFFVLSPKVFDYISGDSCTWEQAPMERLAQDSQLVAYKHHGFWQCMDTLREKTQLEELLAKGNAPWKKYWQTSTEGLK